MKRKDKRQAEGLQKPEAQIMRKIDEAKKKLEKRKSKNLRR